VLAARVPRFPSCGPPFATQLKLKLSEARQNAGYHAARCVRCVDALVKGPQHDAALPKLADSRHHLGCVAAQAVDTDNDNGVAFACVVEQRSKAGTLFAGRRAAELVAVDARCLNSG
jgi:hypothetical protein